MTPAQAKRWEEIKLEYQRQRRMGGSADDPVARLVGTISGLGSDLKALGPQPLVQEVRELRGALLEALAQQSPSSEPWLAPRLDALAEGLEHRDSEAWLGPRLDALAAWLAETFRKHSEPLPATTLKGTGPGPIIDAKELLEQVKRIERSLVPVVGAAVEQRAGDTMLANKMVQIIELLEQLDARLSR
jgi:hypothetical protein